MSKGIGRRFAIGIAKEAVRGTAETSADYWLPFADSGLEEKYTNLDHDEAYGVINEAVGQSRVKEWAEGPITVPMTDQSLPLFLISLFGTDTPATHAGESVVYDHVITLQQGCQHQSVTLFVHDPLAAVDYSHALGVVSKLDMNFELGKFCEIVAMMKTKKGASQSTFSPSITAENRFLPQYITFQNAPTLAGVGAGVVLNGTTTSSSVTVASISSTANLQIGMRVSGTGIPAGATIATIASATSITLSAAATASATVSITYTGTVVKLKSAKLTIDEDVEDDDVLGNKAPDDYLNKNFKIEGTIECLWQNESDFKTSAMATYSRAVKIAVVNTDVTIGTAANPEVSITLAKCHFTEFSRPIKVGDLVKQIVKFKGVFSTTDSSVGSITVVNTVASY